MRYFLGANFSSSEILSQGPQFFGFTDVLLDEDFSSDDYWIDISSHVERLIEHGEFVLSKLFPHGHLYTLSELSIKKIGDVDE